MPKVSVIVPVYNVEKYLNKCIESILAQTLKDIEVLLINDASTDNSLALARTFEKDPRVKVFDKSHGGLGDTRNFGIDHAKGEYLSFIDSDDWIDPEMIESLYASAKKSNSDMVVFNFVRENPIDNEQRICRLPINFPEIDKEIQNTLISELIGPDSQETPWRQVEMLGCAWRRFYRRDWFVKNNLKYFNEQKIMLEDLPVTIMAHCLTDKVLFIGGAYYHYRYNPQSLSTKYRPHKMEMLTECFYTVQKFLKSKNLYDKYEQRHLAWLLRSAAHSSLVNCFSPLNKVSFNKRFKEVKGILKNPLVKKAVQSDYFANGSKSDKIILRVLRTKKTSIVYLFYKFYTNMLLKDARKK